MYNIVAGKSRHSPRAQHGRHSHVLVGGRKVDTEAERLVRLRCCHLLTGGVVQVGDVSHVVIVARTRHLNHACVEIVYKMSTDASNSKCKYKYTLVHAYIHAYIHTNTYIQTCIHACMHACIHTYIHTYIHT